MLILTRAAYGNVVHVPTDQPTIQAGIDAAVNGDTVLVADGTYTGEGNRDIDFLGKAIAVMSENGPESTIVNCQASYENRHRGFIFRGGEDSMSVLQGFTIRNGDVSNGGGIYIANSSPMITDNVITYNDAYQPDGLGGGIYCYNSDARIVGNTISNNFGWQGAGIYCNLGAPVIENNTLSGNYAECVGYGGGIYIEYSAAEIIDNSIMENEASKEGGEFSTTTSLRRSLSSRETVCIGTGPATAISMEGTAGESVPVEGRLKSDSISFTGTRWGVRTWTREWEEDCTWNSLPRGLSPGTRL
jgi:hypothetical protein